MLYIFYLYLLSWGSAVGIALATDRTVHGSNTGSGEILRAVQVGPETYPASPCTVGTGSFQGVKGPERGADHWPFYSAGLLLYTGVMFIWFVIPIVSL